MKYEATNGITVSSDTCAIFCTTTSGAIITCDDQAEQLFGMDKSSIAGRNFIDVILETSPGVKMNKVFNPQQSAIHPSFLNRVIECTAKDGEGRLFPVEIIIIPVGNEQNETYYVHTRDITPRKKKDVSLKASEKRYSQLLYNNPNPMWIFDPETLAFLEVNNAAIRKYGYTRNEFLGMTLKNIRSSEDIPRMLNTVHSIVANPDIRQTIWKHIKKNGELLFAEVTTFPITYFDKTAILAQVCDITETVNLRRELAYQHKMKQKMLTEAIYKAEEKEREAIGRELHDNINQILATSKLYLDVLLEENRHDPDMLAQSRDHILQAIDEIRKLSRTFIAPDVEAHNLVQSIEKLIDSILVARKMKIEFSIESLKEEELTHEHKITIYRIIQEQLNNIIKYAGASCVKIILHKINYKIELLIEDNGRGFDTSQPREGIGITNIISRAAVYNGKVQIDSSTGNGCRLNVVFNNGYNHKAS